MKKDYNVTVDLQVEAETSEQAWERVNNFFGEAFKHLREESHEGITVETIISSEEGEDPDEPSI